MIVTNTAINSDATAVIVEIEDNDGNARIFELIHPGKSAQPTPRIYEGTGGTWQEVSSIDDLFRTILHHALMTLFALASRVE